MNINQDDIFTGIADRIGPRFGMTPQAIAIGIGLAFSVGVNIYQHMTAFDKGWNAYEDAVRDGTAELDGIRFEILTEAKRESIASQARSDAILELQDQVNGAYRLAIQGINDAHANNVTNELPALKPDAVDWGASNVPDSERLRFDEFDRRRANRDRRATDASVDNRTVPSGYPTPDTVTTGTTELGLAGTREDTGR